MEDRENFNFYMDAEDERHVMSNDTEALFSPFARKVMLYTALAMVFCFLIGILFSYPLTILPFGIIVFAYVKYRKATKHKRVSKAQQRSTKKNHGKRRQKNR